ncbi:hypothetical protein [Dyella mobilis]|uniref:Uncharacterized protein n=1 Tax=Dyella mobilis TaxID=1849582 RepID=A0ABS2KEL8_9GAMM|nr:hypothetical protein [Dyella mobilis]MBM7129622.1 hypothetical protein [Dyella mobilis]GLQ98113.1 hypothetical protein GCM10007863_25330 [Dyella mobilis]
MKMLKSFLVSFAIGFAVIWLLTLVESFFHERAFRPFVAAGIAAGLALAQVIREEKKLSTERAAILSGVLVGLGYVLGTWLTH